jgi:hypothetical protein
MSRAQSIRLKKRLSRNSVRGQRYHKLGFREGFSSVASLDPTRTFESSSFAIEAGSWDLILQDWARLGLDFERAMQQIEKESCAEGVKPRISGRITRLIVE